LPESRQRKKNKYGDVSKIVKSCVLYKKNSILNLDNLSFRYHR